MAGQAPALAGLQYSRKCALNDTVAEEVSSISKRIWRKPAMPTGTLQVLRSSAFVDCSSSASAEV